MAPSFQPNPVLRPGTILPTYFSFFPLALQNPAAPPGLGASSSTTQASTEVAPSYTRTTHADDAPRPLITHSCKQSLKHLLTHSLLFPPKRVYRTRVDG